LIVPVQRSLAWRLNWYRQSELEGALLLGRMIRQANDAHLVHELTKHCADEARHAWLWQRTLAALSLPSVRIRRSYQSFYAEQVGPPRTLAEVLALTHVFEHRVHRHFSDERRRVDLPHAVRHTYGILLRDEAAHLDWVARWLANQSGVEDIVRRYRIADARVVRRLRPYADRLWDIEGLGEELTEASHAERSHTDEEFHASEPEHSAPAPSRRRRTPCPCLLRLASQRSGARSDRPLGKLPIRGPHLSRSTIGPDGGGTLD
jgi:tRNA isopentenyl-2-thiomethyl-A-37 hydroxylase MiaE